MWSESAVRCETPRSYGAFRAKNYDAASKLSFLTPKRTTRTGNVFIKKKRVQTFCFKKLLCHLQDYTEGRRNGLVKTSAEVFFAFFCAKMRRRPGVDSQAAFSCDCNKQARNCWKNYKFAWNTPRANAFHTIFRKTRRGIKSNRCVAGRDQKNVIFSFKNVCPKSPCHQKIPPRIALASTQAKSKKM